MTRTRNPIWASVTIAALTLPWLLAAVEAAVPPGMACWNITYESANARCVVPGNDGGFVLAGQSSGTSGKDLLIVKIDDSGRLVWGKTYDFGGQDAAWSVVSVDNGYVVGGLKAGAGTGDDLFDILVAKVDEAGDLLWNFTIKRNREEYAAGICRTPDLGYLTAGYALYQGRIQAEIYVARMDPSGGPVWDKSYGAGQAMAVVPGLDQGYVLAGSRGGDALVLKIDDLGTVLWENTYGGPDTEMANSIVSSGDGGYVLAGYTKSSGAGQQDFWILKVDGEGNEVWERTYGTQDRDEANSIARVGDGYVIGGFSGLYPMNAHFVGIDAGGDLLWEMDFVPTKMDTAYAVAPAGEGFIGVGSRRLDLFAMVCGRNVVPVTEVPAMLTAVLAILAMAAFGAMGTRGWKTRVLCE